MNDIEKIDSLLSHIRNVQDNAVILGKKLINQGEINLGKELIANSLQHDYSKFFGIEWDNLAGRKVLKRKRDIDSLNIAIKHHQLVNKHHPECWCGGISYMPTVYLLELLCDWKSRSEEFGSSLIDYIDESATKHFNFLKNDDVYKTIMKYVDMLCEKPFNTLK